MSKTALHTVYETRDGEVVPSVTTIIGDNLGWNKAALIGWAKASVKKGLDPDKIRDEAGDVGTLSHYLIECYLKKEEPELGDYSQNNIETATKVLESFKEWWVATGYSVVGVEAVMVSNRHKYGGTIDLVAQDKDKKTILIDFKTSSGVYPEHKIQVAAYEELMSEFDTPVDRVYILKLHKTGGSCEPYYISDEEIYNGFLVFESLLRVNDLKGKL